MCDAVKAALGNEQLSAECFVVVVAALRGCVQLCCPLPEFGVQTDRLMALAGGEVLAIGEPSKVINLPEVKRVYLGS